MTAAARPSRYRPGLDARRSRWALKNGCGILVRTGFDPWKPRRPRPPRPREIATLVPADGYIYKPAPWWKKLVGIVIVPATQREIRRVYGPDAWIRVGAVSRIPMLGEPLAIHRGGTCGPTPDALNVPWWRRWRRKEHREPVQIPHDLPAPDDYGPADDWNDS